VTRWPLLWPVLLIGWGLGLLLRGTSLALVGGAVTAITFGVMGGGALATGFSDVPFASGCTNSGPGTPFPARTGEFDSAAQVNLELSCGTMTVETVPGYSWSVEGSDRDGAGPRLATGSGMLALTSDDGQGPFESTGRVHLTVGLPSASLLTLGVTVNAGEGSLVLDGRYASVNLTVNAGEAHLLLAGADAVGDVNATVNAGRAVISYPFGAGSGNLTLNAGSMDLCVAPGTPVRVSWNGTLASNNLEETNLQKVDDDTWASIGFDVAQPHLELHVSANAGSFTLDLSGTCA
jgi:hypothetical protein